MEDRIDRAFDKNIARVGKLNGGSIYRSLFLGGYLGETGNHLLCRIYGSFSGDQFVYLRAKYVTRPKLAGPKGRLP